MTTKAALKYVILYVDDLSKTLTFYADVFGFEEKMRQGPYAEVSTGDTTLAFTEREFVTKHLGLKPGPKGAGSSEVGIVVPKDEVAAFFKKAVTCGAEGVLAPKEQPWGQIVSYVKDPNGHLLEICSPND
jgi:lactoylglutathione lyase